MTINANLFLKGTDPRTITVTGAQKSEASAQPQAEQAAIVCASKAVSPITLADSDREDHFIRRDGKVFAGTHLIIEVVRGQGLDDQDRIEQAFRDCVEQCGATLLHLHTHKFSPQGVSGVAVLAESHISVHTWPEIGYGAFDVFMCGDAQPWKAVDVLRTAFQAGEVRVQELLRGEDLVQEALAAVPAEFAQKVAA